MKRLLAAVLVAALLVTSLFPAMTADAASDFDTAVETRYNTIMASVRSRAVGGKCEINYTTNWYANLEPLEVAARLIYGEAPWWIADKKCVAMVVWNRRELSWYPDTLYDVIVAPDQFKAITGTAGETATARTVYVETRSWQNALRYACIIWTARVKGVQPHSYLGVPEDFKGQIFFKSYKSFFIVGKAKDEGETSMLYSDGEGWVVISDIFVPVHGAFGSVTEARKAYDNPNNPKDELPYYADGESVNIYYYR